MVPGIKYIQRHIRNRNSYKRYKKFYTVLLTEKDPELILIAAHQLVDSFQGHGSMHNCMHAKESVNLLIDDTNIEDALKKNQLPILMGHKFLHSTSISRLESLLKGE